MFTVVVFTFFGIIKKAFIGYIMIIKKKKKSIKHYSLAASVPLK